MDTRSHEPSPSIVVMTKRPPGEEGDGAAGEAPDADLGAGHVGHDRDRAAEVLAGGVSEGAQAAVVGVGAVGEVDPGDVHPGQDQLADPLGRAGGGAEGGGDVGAPVPPLDAGVDRHARVIDRIEAVLRDRAHVGRNSDHAGPCPPPVG